MKSKHEEYITAKGLRFHLYFFKLFFIITIVGEPRSYYTYKNQFFDRS